MGYTNYWNPKTRHPHKGLLTEDFRADLRKLVETANSRGIRCRMLDSDVSVSISDIDERCENFYLETEKDAHFGYFGFSSFCFCKTFELPFDAVVKCAIEIAAKHEIFESDWDFDGDWSDQSYANAVDLARLADVGIYETMKARMPA